MRGWLKVWLWVAAIALVLLGAGYYWFICDNGRPATVQAFALDLQGVRELASDPPGERPREVRVETIGVGSFPETAVIAGEGWNGFKLGMLSYQIVFPDGETIVIDTALNEAGGNGFGVAFDQGAYDSMNAAMAAASQIVVTHEHADHIGGILSHPDQAAIAPRLKLTTEQLASAGMFAGFAVPPGALADARPVAYENLLAVAPGVVLIKAPGHTPGSQIVYVATAAGREFLFIGDIGWSLRNVEEVRGRPRLVSQFMLRNEDRDAVFAQLASLKAIHDADPELVIVPGHDAVVIEGLVADGTMLAGFQP